jgi:hypothetical protein
LQGNAGTEGPTSLLFFDSESHPAEVLPGGMRRELSLRLWVAAYVRRDGDTWRAPIYYRGTTGPQFWDLVDRLSSWKKPLWAFAHNLGHDLTQLRFWDELERWRYTAGPVEREPDPETGKARRPWRGRLCLEGRPTFLVVRGRKGTLKLVDTGNYWPSKLADIGAKFGLAKLAMPAWTASDDEWFDYCQRDVDVCRVAVTELVQWWIREDCGVFQMTGPALAMQNYKHTAKCRTPDGDDVNIVLEEASPARALERASYLGGRIEPFYLGVKAGPIYYLDCNSLYPSVMARELYPRKRVRRLLDTTPKRLLDYMASFGAVADVRINTRYDSDSYPVKADGVQLHAAGVFWTSLAGPELYRALQAGHVERVGECHLYSLAALFRGWSDKWLQRKAQATAAGDTGQAELCKLIGTSLAGKFGQRGEWWVDAPERAPRRAWGVTWRADYVRGIQVQYRYVAGHTQKKVPGNEPANSFPAISAYVTAHAREHMRRAFAVMPDQSLLYTATDSIVCTEPGFQALEASGLVHPTDPGRFRLEGVYGEAEICGPNWYRLDDHWTIAGLHGKSYVGPDGKTYCEVWDHLPSLLTANPMGRCGINTVPLTALKPTHKNAAGEAGFRVPFRLSPDPDFSDQPPRLRCRLIPREH